MFLLTPTLYVKKVTDITVDYLKKMKIENILLDIDDTLAIHGAPGPIKGVKEWIFNMKSKGIGIVIISNNFKKRVKPFAEKLKLPFVSLSLKPLPSGFIKAIKISSSSKEKSIVVGDQIFTDILGANLTGIKSILTYPLGKPRKFTLKLKRRMEARIRRKLRESQKNQLNFRDGDDI